MWYRPTAPLSLLVVLVFTPPACRQPTDPPVTDPEGFVVDAAVRFLNVEGGCWGLMVSQETTYQPMSLPDEFQHDGLVVRVAIKERQDMGSFCMIGPVVEVLWIRRR